MIVPVELPATFVAVQVSTFYWYDDDNDDDDNVDGDVDEVYDDVDDVDDDDVGPNHRLLCCSIQALPAATWRHLFLK